MLEELDVSGAATGAFGSSGGVDEVDAAPAPGTRGVDGAEAGGVGAAPPGGRVWRICVVGMPAASNVTTSTIVSPALCQPTSRDRFQRRFAG